MSVVKYTFLCLVIVAASLRNVNAVSEEEMKKIRESLIEPLTKCGPQFNLDKDAVKEAKEKEELGNVDSCFFACMFKELGFINEKGLYDKEKSLEEVKSIIKGEEDVNKLTAVAEDCSKVNDEEVSDGEKGCDRAKLLFNCFKEHKGMFIL